MIKSTFGRKQRNVIVAVLLAALMTVGGYALTVAITMPTPPVNLGEGQQDLATQSVSGVAYTLSTTDPTIVDHVSFTLATALVAGGKVYMNPFKTGTAAWYNCTVATGTAVTCDTTDGSGTVYSGTKPTGGLKAHDVDQIDVVAAD